MPHTPSSTNAEIDSNPTGGLSREPSAEKIYRSGTLTYSRSGLRLLFFWLLFGEFLSNIMDTVIPNVIPLKLKSLGGSSTLIAFVFTVVPSITMLFWNPIIASWSDRFRSRWGRRIPFLLLGTPIMAVVLVGMGLCDWLGELFSRLSGGAVPVTGAATVVLVLAVFLYHMCNAFVGSPYWGLFNDTVPREFLGRFSMLFRIVSTCAVIAFYFLLFPFAESHYHWVLIGAAVLFTVGYVFMCFNVKEGEYEPPVALGTGGGSWLRNVKGYFQECFGHSFYIWFFMGAAFTMVGNAATPFILLMNRSLGLDLQQIGWIAGSASLISLPVFFLAGFVVDRWNVVKLCYYGRILQTLICAGFMIYLFVDLSVTQVLFVTVTLNILLLVVTAFMLVASIPMNMRLLPRDRYGQFSSAMSVTVGATGIFSGTLLGVFLDVMRWAHDGSDFAYRYSPLWMTFFFGLAGYCQYRVYRHVQANCDGDLSRFTPPDTTVQSAPNSQ